MIKFLEAWKANNDIGARRDVVGNNVLDSAAETAEAGMENTVKIAKNTVDKLSSASTVMITGLILAILFGVAIAYF